MEKTDTHRITLVIHALHGGGAERIAVTMANHWAEQGNRVTVITLDSIDSDRYTVNGQVRRIGLDLMSTSRGTLQAIVSNVRRVRALRRAIRQSAPECVVSLTDRTNIVTLLACRRFPMPVVIAEHSDPRRQRLSRCWEWLRARTYPRCTAAVALTRPIADHLQRETGTPKVHVIPNGIAMPEGVESMASGRVEDVVVAMGRLSAEKGFDLLIRAFAQVATAHQRWRLRILGVGPERARLQTLIEQLKLADRVTLVGWVDQPWHELANASLFVLSSRYEGIPVSLLEAMAVGLPVISFDCESGPREMVRHEVDGLLVPPEDVLALAGAMDRLIRDPSLRRELGRRASEVLERFSERKFFQRWDAVLDDVCPR